MKRRILFPIMILLVIGLAGRAAATAASAPQAVQKTGYVLASESVTETLTAGNYCISCHLADDARLSSVTGWSGMIGKEVNSPCPAATKIHEELYYTERLLLMIERAEKEVGDLPENTQARLDGYTQRYSRMLDNPVTSLDAFVNEAQTTRFQLNKVYIVLNDMADAAKLHTVLMYAGVATLVLLGSLGWGLYNTRSIRAGMLSKSKATFWRAAFVVAVLAFFTLPIFRVPAAEVVMTTTEQQKTQTILDTAQRAADAADRSQARAWMLARIGASWGDVDAAQAQKLMDESLAALETARENTGALWGQSLGVQEATVGTQIDMETADLIATDLNSARARSWALPLIALEWSSQDVERAAALLIQEQEALYNQSGLYRDLQLRSLALAWVKVDPAQSVPLAGQIDDPAIQAWTLRELAVLIGDRAIFDLASDVGRTIYDPVQRARTLSEIAKASGQAALFEEALAALDGVTGASLAYALSDLAGAVGDAALVQQIDPAYPDAQASALLEMGEYQAAWDAAVQINDPYEQARAEAAIAAAWGNPEAAAQIAIPLYRDTALRDVIRQTGNTALVDSLASVYYKIQALTDLGDLDSAVSLSGELGDTYPLIALSVRLADSDIRAALALVDEMSRETDKAVALQAIAAESNDMALFEQARGMALASRVRGDSLAPALASLNLANALLPVDVAYAQTVLQQAYEAAQRIAIK